VVRFLTPALFMLPLLSGIPTQAAMAVTNGHAPLINQTQDGAIVKVAEGCGTGYFRDEFGHCHYYGYGAPAAPPHEACPPHWHFVPWINHTGGRCVPD
jgi:hypothetical protein